MLPCWALTVTVHVGLSGDGKLILLYVHVHIIINNNRRLVTLAEHTSDHGRQTNSSTHVHMSTRISTAQRLTIFWLEPPPAPNAKLESHALACPLGCLG